MNSGGAAPEPITKLFQLFINPSKYLWDKELIDCALDASAIACFGDFLEKMSLSCMAGPDIASTQLIDDFLELEDGSLSFHNVFLGRRVALG